MPAHKLPPEVALANHRRIDNICAKRRYWSRPDLREKQKALARARSRRLYRDALILKALGAKSRDLVEKRGEGTGL